MIDGNIYQFNHLESFIYETIQEYLKLNRAFKLEKIIPYINQRSILQSKKISSEAIKVVFESFLRKKILAESSNLSKEEVLKNRKRKTILSYILDNPGATFNSIVENTGISDHLLAWHLNMLLKFQIINKTHLKNNRDIYFSYDIKPEQGVKFHYLSKSKCKKIFSYIQDDDIGVTKSQLVKELKLPLLSVDKYINILLDFKLILKKVDGSQGLYFLND